MKRVCAWCGEHMEETAETSASNDDLAITHGICDDCEAKENATLDAPTPDR